MDFFLGYPIKDLNKEYNITININLPINIPSYINTLYKCYSENIPGIKGNIPSNDNLLPGVYYVNGNHTLFFEWSYILYINSFIKQKYTIDKPFYISYFSFYIIFFLEFINKHNLLFNPKNSIEFIGMHNCFFGIFDSYREIIYNCEHCLYFSYGLHKFLLYKAINKHNYVCGKLFNNFKLCDNFLIDGIKKYKIPGSFIKIIKNIYGIKKKEIIIKKIKNQETIITDSNYKEYRNMCSYYNNQNIYFLKINYIMNKNILKKLFTYLITKFPILKHKNNFNLVDPDNFTSIKSYFSLYLINKNNTQYLLIHFNQFLFQYLNLVIISINDFFIKLSKSNHINTVPTIILYNNEDHRIHIISEIYYLIIMILFRLPKIINNIKLNNSSNYLQLNYRFMKNEIIKIQSKCKYKDYNHFLIKLLVSSISVFMENYYLFIHNNSNIDIIPVYAGMTNEVIDNYINRSNKSNLSKAFLISYLCKLFTTLNTPVELPVIFLNIMELKQSSKIQIEKIYSKNDNKNIPIFINIVYGIDTLVINLSFKPEYKKIKYVFNEIINSII